MDAASPPDTHVVGQAQTAQQGHKQGDAQQSYFPRGRFFWIRI